MIIQNGTVEYSRPVGAGIARLTMTLDIQEDTAGSAIIWASQVIDQWSAAEKPAEGVLELRESDTAAAGPIHFHKGKHRVVQVPEWVVSSAAQEVPQENPPVAAEPERPAPTAPISTPAAGNPFAISAPAQGAPVANPFVPAAAITPTATEAAPPATEAPASKKTANSAAAVSVPSTIAEPSGASSVELTDNDLHAAAHQAVERKVKATEIKRVTAKYADGSMSIRSIPTEKRAAWLAEVREMKEWKGAA